jgi:hypothetical protein
LSQSPDVSGASSDSPNLVFNRPVSSSRKVAAVSPVSAALRQADAIPATVRDAIHTSPSVIAAITKTMTLTSRAVPNEPRPIQTTIGFSVLAMTLHQSNAAAVAANAMTVAMMLVPKDRTTVAADEAGCRTS